MNNIITTLTELENQIKDNISLSKSKNTLRAYKSDFNDFIFFCKKFNFQYLPTQPKVVGMYLSSLSNNKKFSTLKRRLASINVIHVLKGYHLDYKHPLIRENMIGIKRKIGSYQKGKKPLLYNNLVEIINLINKDIVNNNLQKIRDKAIILLGFSGAFRRSELSKLKTSDLEFVDEGLKITIKFSKNDQFGEGQIKAIPKFSNENICPVIACKKWLQVKKVDNSVSLFNCSDKTIALIVKKYVAKIGLDKNQYSGHSLRSGFATATAEAGADERSIMSMTGHKSSEMVRRYIKQSKLFANNPLNKLIK